MLETYGLDCIAEWLQEGHFAHGDLGSKPLAALEMDDLNEDDTTFSSIKTENSLASPSTTSVSTVGGGLEASLGPDFDFGEDFKVTQEDIDDFANMEVSDGIEFSADFIPTIKEEQNEDVEDMLKSDLMWSSTLKAQNRLNARNRDVSLTLSECADALFKDIDVMGTSPTLKELKVNPELIASIEAELNEQNETANSLEDDEEEEEVDVVSDDAASTISAYSGRTEASTTSRASTSSSSSNSSSASSVISVPSRIAAGRSLLRHHYINNNPIATNNNNTQQKKSAVKPQTRYQPNNKTTVIDHMNGDHCYFSVRPSDILPEEQQRLANYHDNNGILTPNESSDSDDDQHTQIPAAKRRRLAPSSSFEPQPQQVDVNNVKFKFRMKFKSAAAAAAQAQNQTQHNSRSLLTKQTNVEDRSRRRSALKNAHCPSPTKSEASAPTTSSYSQQQQLVQSRVSPQPGMKRSVSARELQGMQQQNQNQQPNNLCNSQEQKSREIRDLHNTMERLRRVDLRNNFDQLKDVVPELAEVDKASKLNILNKAADYCRYLGATDSRLRREKEREAARNAALRQRLATLMRF